MNKIIKNLFTARVAILLFIFLRTALPQSVSAQEVIFQDSFDGYGSYAWAMQHSAQYLNYTLPCMYYDLPAKWERVDNHLNINIVSMACVTEYTPVGLDVSTLPYGYEYEHTMKFVNSSWQDRNVLLLWKDPQNWYNLHIFGDWIWVTKMVNGNPNSMSGFRYVFKPDATYNFKVKMYKNHIVELFINNVDAIRFEDPKPYFTGPYTIGFQASVGTSVSYSLTEFDDVVVRSIPPPPPKDINLGVKILKQIDPLWKNDIYDTATTWSSSPTMGRWGCATTSVAMILQYYNISELPSGELLTPASLNAWLKAQPDGYTSAGYINWQAATRLTRLMSAKLGTPKLEYSRLSGSLEIAQAEIRANRPVIINIPGHFLVADGIPEDGTKLSIKDPVYDYTTLDQHNSSLVSVRKFLPSQTDLSYFFMEHSEGLKLQLLDSQTGASTTLESFADLIYDPLENSGESSQYVIQREVSKPSSGVYDLKLSRSEAGPYSLTLITYDTQANPFVFKLSGFVGTTPTLFRLKYDRQTQSQLTAVVDFAQIRRDLKVLKDLKHFSKSLTYSQLDRTATLGQAATSLSSRLRYAALLRTQLAQLAPSISSPGRAFLNQEAAFLNTYLRQSP